jgi:hypothetical protein
MENPITTVDAVFSGGLFRPLGQVTLPENSHVKLTIQPIPPSVSEWLARTATLREEMFAKYGYYLDSTEIISADRRRDG